MRLKEAFDALLLAHTAVRLAEMEVEKNGAAPESTQALGKAKGTYADALDKYLEVLDGTSPATEGEFIDALHRDLARARKSASTFLDLAARGFAQASRKVGA